MFSPFMRNPSERVPTDPHHEEETQNDEQEPTPRHRLWAVVQALMVLTALGLGVVNALEPTPTVENEVGTNMLVESEPLASGTLCHEGGTTFTTGLDININAVLDEGEVTSTTHVCNGPMGLSGPQGQPGTDGTSPLAQLVETVELNPGDGNCTAGGTLIRSGLDLNGDGALAVEEALSNETLCNGLTGASGAVGADGLDGSQGPTALVDRQPAPAFVCEDGFMIRFGVDDGAGEGTPMDGLLQTDEVVESLNVCFSPLVAERITDLYPGITNSMTSGCDAAAWMPTSDVLVFAASHADHGCEPFLHRIGTNDTGLLADLNNGGGSEPGRQLGFNVLTVNGTDRVFFDADDGTNGRQLWVSDGTGLGTQALGSVEATAPLAWADGFVFKSGAGSWLWTDGAPLVPVVDAPWWTTNQTASLTQFDEHHHQWGAAWWHSDGDHLWFTAADDDGDVEPYRLDRDGQILAWNVNPMASAQLTDSVDVNGDLFVVAQRGTAKQVLKLGDNGSLAWLTSLSPTSGDTALGQRMGLQLIGDNLVYDAQTQPGQPRLWTTHLPSGLSVQLSTTMLAPGLNAGAIVAGGRVIFDCTTPDSGTEVCITDATTMGTRVVLDGTPGMLSSSVEGLHAVGEGWVALADGSVDGDALGTALWASSGSTMRVVYNPWEGSGNDSQAGSYGRTVVSDTQVLFIAHDGITGHEWHRWSHGELSDDWIVFNR
jgi:ELWxxDGT repeat protein